MRGHALVAGATGTVGCRLVEQLEQADFKVTGLCRSATGVSRQVEYLEADLLDYEASKLVVSSLSDITHIFYAARANHGEGTVEPVDENLAMLKNLLGLAKEFCPTLEHVHVVHGAKYYGCHLGSYRTPAREEDPRHIGPNFYYDQQDYLISKAGDWQWSISRPCLVYDFAPQQSRNPVSLIAVYAELSRALGVPLEFPGSDKNYNVLAEAVSASHLAKAIIWIATNDQCANQAFNVTNGDCFRWANLWPEIAKFFQLALGIPRDLTLTEVMSDKPLIWKKIVERKNLKSNSIGSLAQWSFGDFIFAQEWDLLMSTTKLAETGFTEVVDTRAMLLDYFQQYRAAKIIP